MDNKCAVELRHITTRCGKVVANDSIDLTINRGEILSLLGENGSGKTTLMNMLAGIYFPDEGEIYVNGVLTSIRSPKDAFDNHIGMIHQHYKLVDVFTAAENIVLGLDEPGKLDIKAANAKVKEICDRYGFDIDPAKKIYDMSVSQKQTVEIVKVLYRGADTLILDEPTAVLTPQETEKLFNVLRNMRADGKAIVIITHKLHEVMSLSDKVAVLRKGQYIGTVNTAETNPQALTDMMVGHAVTLNIDRPRYEHPVPRLTLDGVTCFDGEGVARLDHVSFTAMGGEILGVAGIAGSGQRELLESIAGLYPVAEGSIRYTPEGAAESELVGKTPMQIKKSGVALAFVPEDRLGMGLVGSMGMTGNMMLRSWKKGKGVFVNRKDPNELAMSIWKELEVVTPRPEFPVRRMSGGNVQKVLVGREIASAPNVLMSAYAVRGLDINTSYTIYNLMTEQKMKGVAVIFVGEDLDVLLELCDRILVLCGGKVSGIVDARTTTKEEIGLMMTRIGGGKEEAVHA
ncbi:MAG: ABC transporter ATP-binding protein [Oscillospiraceae bacterium]|nr:ABC transporter ATP-binding protein [Oscillospiraceae bacterium]